DHEQLPSPTGDGVGRLRPTGDLVEEYVRHLLDSVPGGVGGNGKTPDAGSHPLEGLRVVLDCANGAAYELAPRVLGELGAQMVPMSVEPDGTNINAGCGALHPEAAQARVRESGAHLGVSLDGDADRAIFTDEHGRLVDGDRIMAICALAWKDSELLPGNQV